LCGSGSGSSSDHFPGLWIRIDLNPDPDSAF
jgi:hypothetical protein